MIYTTAGHQQPSLRFLNRYVRGSVGMKWHDLGIELLDSRDVGGTLACKIEHMLLQPKPQG